ncbi:MAG TPA: hypothetical protein VFQ91_00700 [Bryobacteraceae bacterium]|nr:hypothetical protein [Bryobacteraceae bacterium]
MFVVSALFAYLAFKAPINPERRRLQQSIEDASARLSVLQEENKRLKESFAELQRKLDAAAATNKATAVAVERMAVHEKRLTTIEDAISSDPNRAVSLPLLRKDVEFLQERLKAEISLVRDETGRLYSVGQWVVATLISAFFGVTALIYNTFKTKADIDAKSDKKHPSDKPKQ